VEKPDEAGAASTLNTTAKDYALFVEAILNKKGLKPGTLREMETPQIALDPECRICIKRQPAQLSKNLFWGLGWVFSARIEVKRCGIGAITARSSVSRWRSPERSREQ
jgi:CubicO group peptidase (beta-lactamase class C family)